MPGILDDLSPGRGTYDKLTFFGVDDYPGLAVPLVSHVGNTASQRVTDNPDSQRVSVIANRESRATAVA